MAIDTTLDHFLDGTMVLRQPRKGHRIGTDAMLLAAAAPTNAKRIADFGSGVGAVGIAVALAQAEASLVLVERDADICALADENIALNELQARAKVLQLDLFAKASDREAKALLPRSFDLVLTNPPFLEAHQGRMSTIEKRRTAHILTGGTLSDWLRAVAHALMPGGKLVMIHRADELATIMRALDKRFGGISLIFIQPDILQPASRVLVMAILGSRAPLRILPPLILHEASSGNFTEVAQAIHKGQERIDWQLKSTKSSVNIA